MRIDVEDAPQSSSSLRAADGQVSRTKQAGALAHTPPQGVSKQHTRDSQAEPRPGSHVAAQPLKQHRQPDSSQSCLDTDPEGHWQFMLLPHPLPSVQARAEWRKGQCFEGLKRPSPAESPSTPEHRKPTQRVLHLSSMPMTQAQGEGFCSGALGRFQPDPVRMFFLGVC